MSIRRMPWLLVILLALAAGFWAGNALDRISAQDRQARNGSADTEKSSVTEKSKGRAGDSTYLRQSEGAKRQHGLDNDYGLGDCCVTKLKPYPAAKCGEATQLDLYRYAGRGASSWSPPTLDVSWDEWVTHCRTLKPKVMAECRAYMKKHYDFNTKTIPGAKMSGGKPIMIGPVGRLPEGIHSYEELADLSPDDIKKRHLSPSFPLAPPLHPTPPLIFPASSIP